MAELLIELLSEEIPARMQPQARQDLARLVIRGLAERGLEPGPARAFSTPRRIALVVSGLPEQSPTRVEERRGPRADAPEQAVAGFLRSLGLSREQVEERETPKGRFLFARIERPGRPAEEIVAEVLEEVIRRFPWPKSMRWGAGSLRWVRPLHGILCILSDGAGGHRIVPLEVDGIRASDTTRGHRFMAPEPITVTSFDEYVQRLRAARVILDQDERAELILSAAREAAGAAGLELVEDRGLLEEVTGLVEWPVVLAGRIDPAFLDLPGEVLQTSMREHQKFFSARHPVTGRIEGFLTVANIEAADGGQAILAGNARVLAARLSDARFFWENDLRVAEAGLAAWLAKLEAVTFHNRLGSQGDRIRRVEKLARRIAPLVGADPEVAARAARLAKADLASEMVYEFPELQGVMGSHYLRAAGEDEAVAAAAEAHYRPLGPSDVVPREPVAIAVAMADKLDTLAAFWAIGETPTGSRDPFALRRAALGVIRILLENGIRLHLAPLINEAATEAMVDVMRVAPPEELPDDHLERVTRALVGFFHDRLKVHLRERGIRHDVIDAVLALPGADDLVLLVRRAEALAAFLATEDGENLVQGFRRANNILSQAEARDGVEYSYGADRRFAETEEERALFDALDAAEAEIAAAMKAEDFARAMRAMAALRGPIDAFFEAVVVNAENPIVRRNRLNLLSRIREITRLVADLSRIED